MMEHQVQSESDDQKEHFSSEEPSGEERTGEEEAQEMSSSEEGAAVGPPSASAVGAVVVRDEGQREREGSYPRLRTPREPQVLQPDNPLMERFQAALRAHLIRQSRRLDEEIKEMEINFKENSKLFQDEVEVRDLEHHAVTRQDVTIEKEREASERLLAEREKVEAELKVETDFHKETSVLLSNKTIKEEELRIEKESLAGLIKQFSEWERSQNSEITIAQRISEKNKTDKTFYTQDKIYQDLLLVNLTSEVLSLTTKFNELEKNIRQKQSEAEVVSQAVADGNADLEALERENRRLMKIWNHVILKIQQRDRVMVDIREQLQSAEEQYRRLLSQVESYKRSSAAEVKCNETLTQAVARMEADIEMLERVHTAEEEKQRKLRENLAQVANMVELTQRDLEHIVADSKEKELRCKTVQNEADRLSQIKFSLEAQVLERLHQQVVLGKAERQSTRDIEELRTRARTLETNIVGAQNELARVVLCIEQENKLLKEYGLKLDEEKMADITREKELKSLDSGLKRLENLNIRRQCHIDQMNTKLAELSQRNQGEDLTPEEMQITFLEKAMAEVNNSIEELHASWMRQQSSIVKLTQQRNSLLNQLNIYRKQILVMKQKHLKMEFEIDNNKKEEISMGRAIKSLEKRLTSLNLRCSERKGYKESLDSQNMVTQNQLICDLKDAEVKALTLQEEMCLVEIDKEEVRGQIVEAQRDMLAWERKLRLATEVKQSIDKAKAEGGEIAIMKSEIHRMEVRYAQLQKVQEKLAHDMELCISRRDSIMDLAQAREKRTTKRALYTRQQFLKKLDDLNAKIKQNNMEVKAVEKNCVMAGDRMRQLETQRQAKQTQLAELEEAVAQMVAQLAEGQLHKQKNLEMIVRKQRKARQYGEVKAGRYSLLFRQESGLELEMQKQKALNADLLCIVESLNTDFPALDTQVTQVLNTLRSPAA